MKTQLKNIWLKAGGMLASLALIVAVAGTGRGCWFMAHQPDVPEELR